MQLATKSMNSAKTSWIGHVLSGLTALFLLADGVGKLVRPKVVVDTTVGLGYREGVIIWLGVILLLCTILYIIPKTSILGAILLTGFLGGAVATHVRVGESVFSMVFPVILGIVVWGGLCLRDPRLRALIPIRT